MTKNDKIEMIEKSNDEKCQAMTMRYHELEMVETAAAESKRSIAACLLTLTCHIRELEPLSILYAKSFQQPRYRVHFIPKEVGAYLCSLPWDMYTTTVHALQYIYH